ncbi:cytochrome P450 [Ophiobolus disseminans]|uniref:Cytochrome P450 n=1 Tax=Ophiobolus disseminans TaxID=1469910 RepID=A0A6A6ZIN0_9PLEO|nr:cytochrome P450 [Ophiobolus disseminans]
MKLQQAIDRVPLLGSLESRYFFSAPFIGLVVFLCYLTWLSSATTPVVKGPVAGYRSFLEPTFLVRLRFVFNAVGIMNSGYHKFKNTSFIVRRMDTDLTILAPKYLEELRKSGLDALNATHANIHNVLGDYTNLTEMKHNDHFIKAITHCLNPNINEFMKHIQDEVNYSFKVDMPKFEGDEWKSVDIHILLKRIISRVSCRIMLGFPYCRNETMVEITESHTICIFGVTLILRRFPPILHPLVALLIPQRWRMWRNIRETKKMTQDILDDYKVMKASGEARPKTLLTWMVDNAKPHQESLHSLVSTQLAVTVAAVYTSSQVTSHLLVFLATKPQYIAELRQEIAETNSDMENIDHSKLQKMEACLSETLRINPPQTNSPQRRAMREIKLRDGVIIPKGALVAFPATPLSMDPAIYQDPTQFMPFRKENLSVPATTPGKSKLAFGWGVQACPGRFFATKEIKVVTAKLLMKYDIELAPESSSIRRCYDIEDLRILNPSIRLRMRLRGSNTE